MKKFSIYIVAIFIICIININAQVDTLTILHLNDTHSTLSSIGPRNQSLEGTQGGIARAATVIGMTKMTDTNVLTLHAGDVFIGDFFFNKYYGAAELQLLNSLGIDAMTVGNHEWDLTPEALLGALRASFLPGEGFPLLSANIIFPQSVSPDTLRDYILSYTAKQLGNIKAGIFGLTTPETNLLSQPAPYFVDTNIVEIAAAMVDTLKAKNCNVIILLSHLGEMLDQAVAAYVPGINVIVGGHDHYLFSSPIPVLNPLGDTTWIVQAGSNYLDMGKMQLLVNGNKISLINYQIIPLDESIPEEPAVLSEINNMIADIEGTYGPVYTQKIADALSFFKEEADSLIFEGNHDTPIGNLVTDAFRAKTGTDIAIEADGSTAMPLYKGPIVAADAFRVVGYGFNTVNGLGFRIATFNLKGADILAGLEFGLSDIENSDEYLLQVSGMKYSYNPNKPPFSRITSAEINGSAINPEGTYSVTANEFALMFLTYLTIVPDNLYLYEDSTEFQVLSEYIASQQSISPVIEGRIKAEIKTGIEKGGGLNPGSYRLEQNYPNPFNPTTNFEFRIADFGLVTLKVYDILGKEVATIVNKELPAGDYKFQWNASGLASGVYFYRLQAGNYVSIKKLILMK